MKTHCFLLVFLPFLLFFISACQPGNKGKDPQRPKKQFEEYKEPLILANRGLLKKDSDAIAGYIQRRSWKMQFDKNGLWYMIYEKGTGKKAEAGKIAVLEYELSLLDGTLCYSSDSLGLMRFRIGQGGVEQGLEYGVLKMRVGDKARLIMPPHLAKGLIGDFEKIPPRSVLVYDIKLVRLDDF